MNKKYLICSFLLMTFGFLHVSKVQAQGFLERFWENNKTHVLLSEEYDDTKRLYIGFTIQHSPYTNYIISSDPNYIHLKPIVNGGQTSFNYITKQSGSSIGAGLPIRMRINDRFSLTSGIKLMSSEILNFSAKSVGEGPKIIYHLENYHEAIARMHQGNNRHAANFSSFEIPLHVQLYSNKNFLQRNGSLAYRLYLTAGTNYLTHFEAKKYYDYRAVHETVEPPLIFKPSFWSLEGGLGFSLFIPWFKMSFETRYTQSIGNILDHAKHQEWQNTFMAESKDFPNPYMEAIQKIGVRGWQFSIIFE